MLYTIEEMEQPAEKCLTKTVSRDFSTPLFHQSSVDLSFFITKILQLLAMELTYGINLNSSIHCDHRQQHKTSFSPACAMRPPKVHFLWRPNIPCLAVLPHCWEPTTVHSYLSSCIFFTYNFSIRCGHTPPPPSYRRFYLVHKGAFYTASCVVLDKGCQPIFLSFEISHTQYTQKNVF